MFTVRQFDARTLSWWASQRTVIDFDPPYQRRGGLWSANDKAFLVDSIINRYDVPKIYIADFTFAPSSLNTTNKHYAVIDGKQRFEAIFDFLGGSIVLRKDFVFALDPSLTLGGLTYQDLRANYPLVASEFDNYNLTVMSVVTDEEGRINELFVRLNRNKTLTGPEIRNAMQGIVPDLIRKLAEHDFFQAKVKFEVKRGQDLDIAAKFLLVEFRAHLMETKRYVLDRFVEEGLAADAQASDFVRAAARAGDVLDRLSSVFAPRDSLLTTQGALVPYYWLVRAAPVETLPRVRPFLVAFQAARARNKAITRDPLRAKEISAGLAEYDRLSRGINDAGSIEGRFRLLWESFGHYAQLPKHGPRKPPILITA